MKKISYTFLCLLLLIISSCENAKEYDTRAVESLDKLSETIGLLNSCSYTLNAYIIDKDSLEIFNEGDIYMRGPDKMYIHLLGTKGQRGLWYNGKSFSYYSFDNRQYDTIGAPDNILKAIDFIHNKYNIDFPAADIFYPELTDDILENYSSVMYFGEEKLDNIECVLIEATNDDEILQMWIKKESNLPYKMIFESKNEANYYEAVFSNWKSDPTLPDLLFEFSPPSNSTKEQLLTTN